MTGCLVALLLAVVSTAGHSVALHAQQERPNIVIIWGDDIGWYNISDLGDAMDRIRSGRPSN